jgi:hypothetical protein
MKHTGVQERLYTTEARGHPRRWRPWESPSARMWSCRQLYKQTQFPPCADPQTGVPGRPIVQNKPNLPSQAEKAIVKAQGLGDATRQGVAAPNKPNSRHTGYPSISLLYHSTGPARYRLRKTKSISESRRVGPAADYAKQSQTWAGWDIWRRASRGRANGAEQTQFPAGSGGTGSRGAGRGAIVRDKANSSITDSGGPAVRRSGSRGPVVQTNPIQPGAGGVRSRGRREMRNEPNSRRGRVGRGRRGVERLCKTSPISTTGARSLQPGSKPPGVPALIRVYPGRSGPTGRHGRCGSRCGCARKGGTPDPKSGNQGVLFGTWHVAVWILGPKTRVVACLPRGDGAPPRQPGNTKAGSRRFAVILRGSDASAYLVCQRNTLCFVRYVDAEGLV